MGLQAPHVLKAMLLEDGCDVRLGDVIGEGTVTEDDGGLACGVLFFAPRGDAERKVRERLLLETVATDQAVEVGAEEIEVRLEQIAAPEGLDAARLREAIGEDAADRFARDQLIDEKALDFLASMAKVEEVTDS